MKKLALFAVIVFLAIANINGQNKDSFTIKANWRKKEVKEMIEIRSVSFVQYGVENSVSNDTVARYQISVVHKNKKGYRVEWKLVNDSLDYGDPAFIKNYFSQFKYVVETDPNGSFKELSNWEELIELNKEFKEEIIRDAQKHKVGQLELNEIIAQMQLAETKDELIVMCKDLTDILHNCYGEELPLNDTVFEPTFLSNDNIKDGIPATVKTVTADLGNDLIKISYEIIYDYVKLKELFEETFPDQEYKEETIISISEYLYNRKTGWIERIRFYNESVSSEMTYKSVREYIFK